MRAFVQRCNYPQVHNLITIGAQHQGIMDLPGCQSTNPKKDAQAFDALFDQFMADFAQEGDEEDGKGCSWWKKLFKMGVYNSWLHERIVQAQYFKDPQRISEYRKVNQFLADINNDRCEEDNDGNDEDEGDEESKKLKKSRKAEKCRHEFYRGNMLKLNRFVMYMFEDDTQVVPKESSVNF